MNGFVAGNEQPIQWPGGDCYPPFPQLVQNQPLGDMLLEILAQDITAPLGAKMAARH
jgi:hypothetical protein